MKRDLIDTPLRTACNLARSTVGILVIDKQEGKISMPQIPLKPMTYRQFQKSVDTFKKKASQIFPVIIFIAMVIHKECHIFQ